MKQLILLKKYTKRHWIKLLLLSILVTIFSLWCVHIDYVVNQLQSPLDHLPSNVMKPFYRLQCPDMSESITCKMPKMMMISARPKEKRIHSALSWSSQKIDIINTTILSQNYVKTNNECAKITFGNKLFYVYRQVFKQVLKDHPDHMDFIFVEDDVVLLNFEALRSETCHARANGLNFYSFGKTKSQGDSCVYEFGTVAFYIRRELVEHVSLVDAGEFCRKPIDMYIAAAGPWFASVRDIVKHNATKRYDNIKKL